MAEGDICTLYLDRLMLAINLEHYSKEELQPTVLDVVDDCRESREFDAILKGKKRHLVTSVNQINLSL